MLMIAIAISRPGNFDGSTARGAACGSPGRRYSSGTADGVVGGSGGGNGGGTTSRDRSGSCFCLGSTDPSCGNRCSGDLHRDTPPELSVTNGCRHGSTT